MSKQIGLLKAIADVVYKENSKALKNNSVYSYIPLKWIILRVKTWETNLGTVNH